MSSTMVTTNGDVEFCRLVSPDAQARGPCLTRRIRSIAKPTRSRAGGFAGLRAQAPSCAGGPVLAITTSATKGGAAELQGVGDPLLRILIGANSTSKLGHVVWGRSDNEVGGGRVLAMEPFSAKNGSRVSLEIRAHAARKFQAPVTPPCAGSSAVRRLAVLVIPSPMQPRRTRRHRWRQPRRRIGGASFSSRRTPISRPCSWSRSITYALISSCWVSTSDTDEIVAFFVTGWV